MAVTRIKNNQITDSTITYQKIANGTLVGSNFNANLTLNSNVTILGNLTVANNYIQLNSINTYINDPIVVFNNNYTGSLSGYDIGILVNRNLASMAPYGSVNTFLGWVEADQAFEALATTDTGAGITSINNSGYANVKIGNTTVTGFTSTGDASFTTANIGGLQAKAIGNVTPGTAAFTTLGASGIVTFTNATQNTGSGTGALQVTGGAYIGGNLFVAGNISATSQAIAATSGVFYGNAAGFGAIYAGINSGYVVQPQTPLQVSTNFNGYAQVNHQNINSGSNASTDYVATADNGTAVDTYIDMGINSSGFTPTATQGPNDGYLYIHGNTVNGGGNLLLASVHNDIVFATNGTDISSVYEYGRIKSNGNVFVVKSTTAATNTTSGALQLAGGMGVQGAIYAGSLQNTPIGSTTASTAAFTTVTAAGLQAQAIGNVTAGTGAFTTLTASGVTQVTNATQSTSSSTGALQVTGGAGIGANLYVGGNATIVGNLQVNGTLTYLNTTTTTISGTEVVAGVLTANSTTASTSSTTGALVVAGGAGVAGALYTGGVVTAAGNIVAASGTSSTNTTTGALVVVGGVGISGALNTGANITVAGTAPAIGTPSGSNKDFIIDPDGSGNVILSANTYINYGTASTSTTTGALVVTGGVGISGTVYASGVNVTTLAASGVATISGNIVAAATTATNDNTTGSIVSKGGIAAAGNINVAGQMFIGASAQATSLTSALAVKRGTSTSGAGVQYTQDALINATNTGSSDFIAYANNYPGPSNDHGWMDLGFTGDAFSDPVYSITKANDGYLFASGANATVGGNLVLSTDYTGSYNDIVLGVGSFYANSEVARFHGNTNTSGTFVLKLPTNASPSANTGAFQVWGGASFGSNVYHGGATVLNGSQTAGYDTIVKGVNDNTLLWARPSSTYDQVLIGNSATASTLVRGAKLQINTTDSILIPAGTNAQRPGSAGGTDTAGMIRYNTTLNSFEYYGGSTPAWNQITSSFTVIADQQFNGDGSTTGFTLSSSQTTASCIVSINGIVQVPTVAYSVSGTTLTFTEAPINGDLIDVRMLTTTQTVTNITSTSGYNSFSVDNNGAYITAGTNSATVQYTVEPYAGALVVNGSNVTIASAGTSVIDNLFANSYSSAKYTITATIQGTNIREITEVLMVHTGNGSGAGSIYMSSYGRVNTAGNTLVTYSGATSGNIASLQATTTNANTILRIKRDYMAI